VLGWVGTGATRSTLRSRPYLPLPRRFMGLPLQDAPELWLETSQVLESVSSARPRDVSDARGRLHRRAKVLITRDIGSWSTGWYLTLSEGPPCGSDGIFPAPASHFSTMHGECRAIAAAARPLITGAYES
jgi:hypothetical protein